MGKLQVCGTPIGNLKDITLRVLEALENCDMIYAEDTRRTVKLLNHFEIKKPIKSYHEHNKLKVEKDIIYHLKEQDLNVVLVTDAGMPGISDPGEDIIKTCIIEQIDFEILPGPTAFTTALVGSGLSTRRFAFEGFLDRQKKKRKDQLENLKNDPRTLIIYESPHRIKDTLKDMLSILGNRQIVLCRELTKKYEEYKRQTIEEMIEIFNQEEAIKGEMVIVIEGQTDIIEEDSIFDKMTIEEHYCHYIEEGLSKKEAIKTVAKDRNMKKQEVYKLFTND